jgi:nitrogenase molybdenum-iron protein beta chain
LYENFDIASSSVHEEAAVFGATKRAEEAIDSMVLRYPDVRIIPIITTCSTETIGDDVDGLVIKLNRKLKKLMPDRKVHLVAVHTPSYNGSHVTGYDVAVKAIVESLATQTEPNGKVNVFTGWVNPGDLTEIKHIFKEMDVDATFLMDIENFDSPTMPEKNSFSHGSTTIEDLQGTADAKASLALCKYSGASAAKFLKSEFGVPCEIGPTPIGIANTDAMIQKIAKMSGKKVPTSLVVERGKAIDALADLAHMFFANKNVAIFGDPDLVIGLAEFCQEVELQPTLLLIGDDNQKYYDDARIQGLKDKAANYNIEVIWNADLWELEKRVKEDPKAFQLIMGHSKGRYVAIDNKIPMIRVGFPTFDRAGLYRQPIMGYKGAMYLGENIANAMFTDMEYKKEKEYILNVW